jgi:hypothetical protein
MSALNPSTQAREKWPLIAGVCVAAGVAVGAAAALVNPIFLLALAVIAPVAVWVLSDVKHALTAMLIVLAVMPRFASPVSIGFKPTFLDATLIAILLAWAVGLLGPRRLPLRRSVIAIPTALLICVAIATFIVGIPNGPLTTLVVRRFAELVLSLLMAIVLVSILNDQPMQEFFVKVAMLMGGLSALIGITLYVIPDDTAIRLLSALRVFDYPTGPGVLRFVVDDPSQLQRATGTWIDPNAYGGYLLIAGALTLPQVFARKPVLPRAVVVVCMALIALALVLSVSRGAMLGLSIVAVAMGLLRYRRLLALMAAVLVLALILPQTRALVEHFAAGFAGQDLATQMRFGEYKDAFELIERYPVLGVGFIGTPDVDLYIGVSSMYLLVAQQMGVLGLIVFASVFIALFIGAARSWPAMCNNDRLSAIFIGAHGAVLGALFTGIFDHYFFNIDFHNSVMLLWSVIALAAATQLSAKELSQ